MKIKYQKFLMFTLVSWVIGIVSSYLLPAGSVINLHYSLDGSVNLSSSSPYALLIFPVLISAILIFFLIVRYIEPRIENLAHSHVAVDRTLTIAILLLIVVQGITIAQAFSWLTVDPNWILTLAGIVMIFFGNYLPKTKSNYSFGIRTPWTLADDDIWRKTHRFAGVLFMLIGVVTVAISTLDFANKRGVFALTVILTLVVVVFYSFILSRRKSKL